MSVMVRIIDPDQNGEIVFDEVWGLLAPALNDAIQEMKVERRGGIHALFGQ